MEQNKKEVVFDGKDLIFNVDGIEIKNGKLPDSFEIKERYEISAESLTKLVCIEPCFSWSGKQTFYSLQYLRGST